MSTKEKVCKICKRIVRGNKCPICSQSSLSTSWKGMVFVKDPSCEIAQALGITTPGKYCLKVVR